MNVFTAILLNMVKNQCEPRLLRLTFYPGLIFLIWLILISLAHVEFIMASVGASELIHHQLVESVLAATFR